MRMNYSIFNLLFYLFKLGTTYIQLMSSESREQQPECKAGDWLLKMIKNLREVKDDRDQNYQTEMKNENDKRR